MARTRRGSPGAPHRAVTRAAVRKDILVFVEGERTEEDYLVHWHRLHRTSVNVVVDPFHGPPRQLIDRAARAKRTSRREERRGRGRSYDEVWCVFDIDDHPSLNEVETMARDNEISVAVSSPCIELWFVLHFEDQTAHIERTAAQERSRELLGCGKALNEAALAVLEERYEAARQRARHLDEKHHGDGSPRWTNPSSGVWQIIDSVKAS